MSWYPFILTAAALVAAGSATVASWSASEVQWRELSERRFLELVAGGGAAVAASIALLAQLRPQVIWLSLLGAFLAAGLCAAFAFARGIELLHQHKPRINAELAAPIPIMAIFAVLMVVVAMTIGRESNSAYDQIYNSSPKDRVYNAAAEPNGAAPDVLLNRVPTKLFFNIGPSGLRNILSKPEISRRLLKDLSGSDSADLAVVMTCYICKNELPQTRFIRYSAPRKDSTVAEFSILPDLDVAEERKAQSISFSIRRHGNELDFLNVPVRIQPGPGPA
jgi:hypothetical protein